MTIDELITKLKKIRAKEGNIEVLVEARDSGGSYHEFVEVEIGVEDDVRDCEGNEYEVAVVL